MAPTATGAERPVPENKLGPREATRRHVARVTAAPACRCRLINGQLCPSADAVPRRADCGAFARDATLTGTLACGRGAAMA